MQMSPKQQQAKHTSTIQKVADARDKEGAKKRRGGHQACSATPHGENLDSSTPQEQSQHKDCNGRRWNLQKVVVNFANVGHSYGKKVLNKPPGASMFQWEGVRRCVRYLKTEMNLQVTGVIHENFLGEDNGVTVPLPADIKRMCETVEETPRTGQARNHRSADDEMTIKCAYRRVCRFLDNDNYSEWMKQLSDDKIRSWLQTHKDFAHMRYYFDTGLGSFDVLGGNYPTTCLAHNEPVDKRDLSRMGRG